MPRQLYRSNIERASQFNVKANNQPNPAGCIRVLPRPDQRPRGTRLSVPWGSGMASVNEIAHKPWTDVAS